jgi:hypothetical protein
MRAGLLMSILAHVLLVAAVAIPHHRQTAHGETMAVDLVPSAEAPPPPEEVVPDTVTPNLPPKPEPLPDAGKSALGSAAVEQKPTVAPSVTPQPQAQSAAPSLPSTPPAPRAPEPPPAPPQGDDQQPERPHLAESLAEQGSRLAALLNLPPPGPDAFGSNAESGAKLEAADIAAFKDHLRKCWTLPPGVAPNQRLKLIIRVALQENGTLAVPPALIEAAASPQGPPLFQSAIRALKQCEPYSMLPASRYQEWRVLDLNFSPDQMSGG